MTPRQTSVEGIRTIHDPTDIEWRLLHLTTRLLLEYSARSEMIERLMGRLARHLDVNVSVSVAYREATLFAADGRSICVQVPELRLNAAVNLATLQMIDDLCAGRVTVQGAIDRLEGAEGVAPEYGRWLLILVFALGASALAWILRADWGAIAVSGVSSGLGLLARKELGKRHAMFFALPFTAALIGALLGGAGIRAGWTQTPGICLIVPALMLVPGPHLILSVQEMLENHMQSAVVRLWLAVTILLAAALGVLVGVRATLGTMGLTAAPSGSVQLTLPLDVVLAGLVATAFGAFYNTPRRILWVVILCGMIGHGVRYLGMEQGMSQVLATLLGCLVIGSTAMIAANAFRLPFATVAFAAAVAMMPGVYIYECFAAALSVSAAGRGADPALVAVSVALFLKSIFIIGAMTLGLLLGAWLVGWVKLVPAGSRTVE
jgi:uncharacterized membrane protein YjjP (DUF1212 family)